MNLFKKMEVFVAGIIISTFLSTNAFAADYMVMQNDSLYKIGVLFNTNSSSLKSDNQLNTTMIYPGQILDVPAKEYTIKNGDSLYLISKEYGISLYSLRKANNKWDNLIIPGQQIILPGIKPSSVTKEASTSNTVISYTKEEVNLMARLITAETTGQPYDAMVGVGAVVVNRVQNTAWPSTIRSVIYHISGGYYQFTPVKNGHINNPPSDIALKATWAALYGSDPSKGSEFYFDDSSTNQWLWSKPINARIGRMVFVE